MGYGLGTAPQLAVLLEQPIAIDTAQDLIAQSRVATWHVYSEIFRCSPD